MVSREYAGLAEAGGVKNVVKALAEAAAEFGFSVTVFLPRYGNNAETLVTCTDTAKIRIAHTLYTVKYFELLKGKIRFIFIDAEIFSEKKDIYTYCAEEIDSFREKLHRPDLKKGDGYVDSHEMNILFQKAVCRYGLRRHIAPNVLHCHDAHTALLPAFIFSHLAARTLFHSTHMLITIHNAGDGYRQTFHSLEQACRLTGLPRGILEYGLVDQAVEPFLTGSAFADLTTVSPWYAEQLISPNRSPYAYRFSQALAEKNIHIAGITNGIDFSSYDPRNTDISELPFSFNIAKGKFEGKYACRSFLLDKLQNQDNALQYYHGVRWFGSIAGQKNEKILYLMYHGRFAAQKGIGILLNTIPRMLEACPSLRFIIMGQGNSALENKAAKLAETLQGKFVYCKGYNRKAARLITAAADFIILPSLFEPCGLEDLIAQVYGTIPLANAQGGLQKIVHGQTGFLYTVPEHKEQNEDAHSCILMQAVLAQAECFFNSAHTRLIDIPRFRTIIMQAYNALYTDFSWDHIFAKHYLKLYRSK